MPQARYRSGVILVPVWPTCIECGRQPSEVTTRETPTTPPSSAGELFERGEPVGAADAAAAADHHAGGGERDAAGAAGRLDGPHHQVGAGSPPAVTSCTVTADAGATPGTAATASVATVSSAAGASSTASSSSRPAHRWRTRSKRRRRRTRPTATQFAAIGSPVIAPRWASTSLPCSVPAATTAVPRTVRTVVGAEQLREHARPRLRRVAVDAGDHVDVGGAVGREVARRGASRRRPRRRPRRRRLRPAARGPGSARAARRPRRRRRRVSTRQQTVIEITPISASTATRAGTAAGPWPRTVACFRGASGTRSLVIRTSPAGTAAGRLQPVPA